MNAGRVPQWSLGDRLRKAREVAGMSQQDWADEVGISRGSVANYEAGKQKPRRPVLLAWAMRSGVQLDWLAGGENPPSSTDYRGDIRRFSLRRFSLLSGGLSTETLGTALVSHPVAA